MIIRKGTKKDIPQTLKLIKELAEYENALNMVSNTIERLENDGFGKNKVFDLFVAEKNKKIIGIALTFFRYLVSFFILVPCLKHLIQKQSYRNLLLICFLLIYILQ